MAEQTVSLSGPVRIESDSASRVAYDLMLEIARMEARPNDQYKERKYWFTLYSQCLSCVHGASMDSILKKGQ